MGGFAKKENVKNLFLERKVAVVKNTIAKKVEKSRKMGKRIM